MKLSELFLQKRVLSFEVFPPKRTSPIGTVYHALSSLQGLSPDFISVTYGASGGAGTSDTLNIASSIKKDYMVESVAHLPCISLTKRNVLELLEQFRRNGIENILALRGDLPPDREPCRDFTYASDLISFIKEQGNFHILAACYPEGHPESKSIVDDIRHLKTKVEAGADQLISQLFFGNDIFHAYREKLDLAGISVPLEAGIMPVVNKKQIERMVSLCHVHLPKKFIRMMERFEHNPIAMRDAGIAYAVEQIIDLVAQGVDGIHLYTMNNPYVAGRICEATASIIRN